MDKVLRFNGFSGVFQEDIFVPKTITTTEHMSPFIKEMRGVCNATTQIIKYLDIIQPIVTEYHSWHNTWNIGDYTPKKDIPRFIETSEKLENPSRMVLMSSNMAILDSITLFKSTVGLLRE